MTFFKKAALATTVAATALLASTSAQAATASATASAEILSQITVTKTADLNFATIVVGTTGGNVDVSPAGVVTCDAALTCTGTAAAAAFSIAGTVGELVDISSDATVTLTSLAGDTMTASLTSSDASLTLDGTDAFTVGGTLAVAASQAAGLYNGTFNVTVNYN